MEELREMPIEDIDRLLQKLLDQKTKEKQMVEDAKNAQKQDYNYTHNMPVS